MIWGASNQPGEPDYFFWDLLRKYVVVFGRTFSDVVVQRTLANNVITDIKVPLEYAAKDKTIVHLEADPDLDRPFSALLPIMTFELGTPAIEYDPAQRKIQTLAKQVTVSTSNNNSLQVLYSPVPYNVNFNLYIYVKNQEDGAKILEQILPFFQPDWTPQVELIPQFGEIRNVPIQIGPISTQDLYDGDFKVRRLILYTIPFKMRALFYGPERNKPVIKFTTLNLRAGAITNNQVTITYLNSNGNFQSNNNVNVYSYFPNNASMANGTICLASYQNPNGNTGTLVINTVAGSFANATTLFLLGNTVSATVNTFYNGIFDDDGNLLSNPAVDESIIGVPGMTANGQATTDITQSVNYTLVNIEDDYGFATAVAGLGSPYSNTAKLNVWNAADDFLIGLSNNYLTATGMGTIFTDANLDPQVRSVNTRSTGKVHFEVTINKYTPVVTQLMSIGIASLSKQITPDANNFVSHYLGEDNLGVGFWLGNTTPGAVGAFYLNQNQTTVPQNLSAHNGDTYAFEVDFGANKMWVMNVTQSSGWNGDILANQNPATNTGGFTMTGLTGAPFAIACDIEMTNDNLTLNAGQKTYLQSNSAGFTNW